jgi:tRNA threonylcarbamoyladenosine biosynthesis protein TsaB
MIPLVRTVLEEAGLAPAGLAAIAVGRGPAPYTGLRIGLMTAQTLGFALGIPVWGVCDLDVLAADAAIRLGLEVGQSLLAALDAKRREVYWASYRVDAAGQVDGLVRLEGPAVSAPAAVPPAAIAIGPGVALYPEALGPVAGQVAGVDPVVLARLAAARAARGQDVTSRPLYLRRPQVAAPAPAKRATP